MLLKLAEEQDLDFILGASEDLHSNFSTVPFDKETTKDTVLSFIEADPNEAVIIVAFNEEKYLGVLACMLSMLPFSTSIVSKELLFRTNGNPKVTQKLYEAYDVWSKKVGADQILMSAPPVRTYDKWKSFYSKEVLKLRNTYL